MSERVVITGLGVICPLAHDVEDFWQALMAGKSGADKTTIFDASTFPTTFSAEVKNYNLQDYTKNPDLHKNCNRVSAFVIGGGESTEFVFAPEVGNDEIARMGFLDAQNPIDGIYIEINDDNLSGINNGAGSNYTETSFTVVDEVFYTARIWVNVDATESFFELYSEAGDLLWASNLTSHFPTAATGHGSLAFRTSGGSVNVLQMDYQNFWINRDLIR